MENKHPNTPKLSYWIDTSNGFAQNITTKQRKIKMSNYTKVTVKDNARTELHDMLGLTGAEISVNNLPAGAKIPRI